MRCKMTCISVTPNSDAENPMSSVAFQAKYNPEKSSEDAVYGKYTPAANFNAQISTPVAEKLVVGADYYVDFTPAE